MEEKEEDPYACNYSHGRERERGMRGVYVQTHNDMRRRRRRGWVEGRERSSFVETLSRIPTPLR